MSYLIKISKIVSIIFNPILNSSTAFILLIITNNNLTLFNKLIFLILSISFSTVIPLSYVIYLKQKGKIESVDVDNRKERINPFWIGTLSYFIGFIILFLFNAPMIVQGLMFCYFSNTLVVLFITHWWKVSVHSTGICGPLVALHFNFGKILFPFYLLVIIVGLSRLILKKHTFGEVLVGIFIGIVFTAFQIYYFFL